MVNAAVPLVVAELSAMLEGLTAQETCALAALPTEHERATVPVNPFVPPTTTVALPPCPDDATVIMVGLAPLANA